MSVEENIAGPLCQGVQIAGFSSPPPEVSPPGVQSFPDSAAGAAAGPAGDGAPPGPAGYDGRPNEGQDGCPFQDGQEG